MTEDSVSDESRRWLRFSLEDLSEAKRLVSNEEYIPRHACWLAQQSVEKALNAILIFLQIDFPRKHDLDALRNLIPDGWKIREEHPDLAELTEWAVLARYPGDWPDPSPTDARRAVKQARSVWETIAGEFSDHGLRIEN